jgi:hypothetical protein
VIAHARRLRPILGQFEPTRGTRAQRLKRKLLAVIDEFDNQEVAT